MTVGEAVAALTARFASAGVPTPAVDAGLLVRHVLGWPGARLALDAATELPAATRGRLEELADRRAAREPLQLLLGSVGFRHLELQVEPGVFIPRPETEVLAGEAIARTPVGAVVVEPCTGSGAVACAVAQEAEPATVVATDTSPAAVALARRNAAALRLDVQVCEGDLLEPVPRALRGRVDMIVSNPPYLAEGELAAVEPEVRHDPLAALVSGPTGREVVDRLLGEGRDWLRPGGWLLLELDHRRAAAAVASATAAGYTEVVILPDLTGSERVLAARRGPTAPHP